MERLKLLAVAASVCALAVLAIGSAATGAKRPDPVDVAIGHVQKNARALGLRRSDIRGLRVSDRVTSRHTGVTHVYLQQTYRGIDVAGGMMTVNVRRNGKVLSVGNRFVRNLSAAAAGQQVRDVEAAVLAAARHVGLKPKGLRALKRGTDAAKETVLSAAGISRSPLRAQLMWHQVREDSLRLAWYVLIDEADGQHVWSIAVDAQTGAVLEARDEIVHDNVADIANALARTDAVESFSTAAVGPAAAVADGSSYRVYEVPKESPSDGDRTLVENPASALASPFGWHDTDGVAGAEFMVTRGNNVHAYTDRDANNVPDAGSDPDGGAGLDFDFPLDLADRPFDYKDAAVTNLFYWNNVVHDVLYGYGFNEASGNFQVNNYGRGGLGNDDVRAEAQDGSGRNNANFFTPAEGLRPRMQMFEWRSSAPNPIVVHEPSPIAGTYFGPMAGFGESLNTTGPISGEVVYVGRGCDPAYQTAVPPIPFDPYLANPAGKIALIDRGVCTFVSKVKKAQDNGALMVIVANNAPGPPFAMGGADPTITIPSVMVSQSDGDLFRANVPFNATVSDGTGGVPDRDSDLDAGVIAHEYGHGLSNRLTGGPLKVINCLNNREQMGEGWSDYLALVLTTHPADTATTGRGVGSYVVFQPADGPGIRPRPYTTDMSVNEFTYASIPGGVASGTLTIPHGIGFVWNSMLWEVYWILVRKHGYNPNVYDAWNTGGNNLAIQLVTDGLKLQPCRPGFVDGRDAILSADAALTGGENQCEIWRGFAKRGLGFGASQGSSDNVNDGVASFELPPSCSTAPQHFQSYDVAQPELSGETVGLSDRFGSRTVRLEEIEWLMNPVEKTRAGGATSPILRDDEHYTCHGFGVPSYTEHSLRVTNQFVADSTLRIGRPLALCAPAQKRRDGPPAGLPPTWQQHYECYDVRSEAPRFPSETVTLSDQFGTRSARLDRAREFCAPVEKRRVGMAPEPILNADELYVCYRIVSHTPPFLPLTVFTHDQFRQDTLNVVSPRRLCVPSTEVAPAGA